MKGDGTILEVVDLKKHFGGIAAVNSVGFTVDEGSVTALIGPNGAGKTSLFNVISGFYRPESGAIRFRGREIHRLPPHAISRLGLVRTFQITKALGKMTVLENVELADPRQPGEHLWRVLLRPAHVRRREQEVKEKALKMLELVHLNRLAGAYAETLSGGQRKLLEFARALMTEPKMLMLDEPMAGVNPSLGLELLEHMEKLRERQGLTFLFIEHDMEVVMTVSDRVVVMNEGKVIADGTPDEVRNDEAVIDAYLGAHRGERTGEAAPPAGTGEPGGVTVKERRTSNGGTP
jgi:neutral amino acid transport system ATP-binding protein